MSELPKGWVYTTIGAITSAIEQRPPNNDGTFKYVDIASIDRQTKKIIDPQILHSKEAPSRARKVIEAHDVLVSMTRPNLNSVAMVGSELHGEIASTGFDVLRADQIDARWLFNTVRSPNFVDAMSSLVQGALYPAIKVADIRSYELPLAPLAEQKRIADKLDTVLARVDACRERLNRVPLILKRFRQSVLAAATSGKLTEDWRKILTENACEWKTVKLSQIGELGRGKSKHRPRNDPKLFGGDFPFIQTGDITNSGGLITEHTQTYSEFGMSQSKLWPAETLCITIAANIADTAILSYPACFPDSVVGFAADKAKCSATYIKWTIDVIKADLEAFAPATAQKNINLSILNDIEFELPPIEEQTEIVRRVETLFAFADRLEARLASASAAADKLTPALLAKAFRGELVPQDPNDEPASALLQRLAQAKTSEAGKAGQVKKPRAKRGAALKPE